MIMKFPLKSLVSRFAVGITVAALAAGSLMAAAAPVYAQTGTTPQPKVGQKADNVLSKAYQREQEWLNKQVNLLSKSDEAAARAQQAIDRAKSNGQDTSTLEAALAAFNTEIGTAKTAHDAAAQILSTHNGFDASGNVTDRTAAQQTVVNARQSLNDAHSGMVKAVKDLNAATKSWHSAIKTKVQDAVLAKAFQGENSWLSKQTDHLSKANDAAVKVQDVIDQAKAKGLDTASLEQALASFKTQIAAAQQSHDAAASILFTHSGFDANGNATDPVVARQTVMDARQQLMSAHTTLMQAGKDLHAAMKSWREAHPAEKTDPTAAPTAEAGTLQ